jgi:hypothetical protein
VPLPEKAKDAAKALKCQTFRSALQAELSQRHTRNRNGPRQYPRTFEGKPDVASFERNDAFRYHE